MIGLSHFPDMIFPCFPWLQVPTGRVTLESWNRVDKDEKKVFQNMIASDVDDGRHQ